MVPRRVAGPLRIPWKGSNLESVASLPLPFTWWLDGILRSRWIGFSCVRR